MEITPTKLVLGGITLLATPFLFIKGCAMRNEIALRREAPSICVVPSKKLPGQGYLRGKIAIVDGDGKWDPILSDYAPAELRPKRPSEISTCVVIDWKLRAAGVYNVSQVGRDGTKTPIGREIAKEQTCVVRVVDLGIPAVVAEASFQGGVPEGVRSDGTGPDNLSTGHKPIKEIEDFLYALPRKE